MKEVVLDTETTGISVKDGHRIVEIGCIELENLIPTKNIFHCYLNPERKVSEKALEIHGYTDEFLSDKKKFYEIAQDFLFFIKNKRLIIHNAEFDLAHLNNEILLMGENEISNEVIDTLVLARNKFPGSPASLDALCKRYRIDINLIDQKEPTLNFNNAVEEQKITKAINANYFKKIIKPNLDELKKHDKYLKENLKKNNFN